MKYGDTVEAGIGRSTILASMDFETYSEAGYRWDGARWRALMPSKPGLRYVGAWVYSEHPTAEVLVLAYNLRNGVGPRLWRPGEPAPFDLFAHIAAGGLVEAHNSFFEYAVWTNVCCRRYGWPALPLASLRDSQAKVNAWALPPSLENAAKVLGSGTQKDRIGSAVMRRVTKPRTPTKNNPARRYTREGSPNDFDRLDSYCVDDVRAEEGVSILCPDLSPFETRVFLADQAINARGVATDTQTIDAAVSIIAQAERRYNAEMAQVTHGGVMSATALPDLKRWLRARGFAAESITKDNLSSLVADAEMAGDAQAVRALGIRQAMGSASVQKTLAMQAQRCRDGRLRGLYKYAGASRTWRWAGSGPQPQNIPGGDFEKVPERIEAIRTGDLDQLENRCGDAFDAIQGVLRALFVAGEGCDLIDSDFSSIEAVVLSELAGEPWRQEVFRTHGKIYEMTAARLFGVPFESVTPTQRKVAKVAELASGYGGWVNAWKKFGADELLSDDEIEKQVRRWRGANPMVCRLWEAVEECALEAIRRPGLCFRYRRIAFQMHRGTLYCRLPSGRCIPYHAAEAEPRIRHGRRVYEILYRGPNKGQPWAQLNTYGGKLVENITQATARDIFAAALVRLEDAGYPVVLHTHDEPCSEVPKGTGSVEHFESLLVSRPDWCADWPIRADGGWRGFRYRKG